MVRGAEHPSSTHAQKIILDFDYWMWKYKLKHENEAIKGAMPLPEKSGTLIPMA
jgi:hypothetical protein